MPDTIWVTIITFDLLFAGIFSATGAAIFGLAGFGANLICGPALLIAVQSCINGRDHGVDRRDLEIFQIYSDDTLFQLARNLV